MSGIKKGQLDAIDRELAARQAEDEALGIWTAWTHTTTGIKRETGEAINLVKQGWKGIHTNNRYTVMSRYADVPGIGRMTWLSIRRNDRLAIRDWRELQRIKNELVDPEAEAVELFPAESRLVDTANQFHLWCGPPGMRFPMGFQERLVLDVGAVDGETFGHRQRKL